MPATYEKIATTTVSGGSTNTIDFTSISSAYTDLKLIANYSLSGGSALFMTYNNNTGSIYSDTNLDGDGTSASSSRRTSQTKIIILSNGTSPAFHQIDIFSYAGSTFKTCLVAQSIDGSTNMVRRQVGLAQTTSAISSVKFELGNPVFFTAGSMFTLYGILKA